MNPKANQGKLSIPLQEKMTRLSRILQELGSVLVAFSGGVDSTLLLYVARKELGEQAVALVASSPTYPDFEITKAKEILREWGVRLVEVSSHELEIPAFKENSPRRCYYCKQELFQKCREKAEAIGLRYVADGANFDDRGDYRPGMEAARELGIRSPLMEAGFTKADIRRSAAFSGSRPGTNLLWPAWRPDFPTGRRFLPGGYSRWRKRKNTCGVLVSDS